MLFGEEINPVGNDVVTTAALIDLNPGSANNAEEVVIGGAYGNNPTDIRLALCKITVTSDTS